MFLERAQVGEAGAAAEKKSGLLDEDSKEWQERVSRWAREALKTPRPHAPAERAAPLPRLAGRRATPGRHGPSRSLSLRASLGNSRSALGSLEGPRCLTDILLVGACEFGSWCPSSL